jgi:two-component system OmpR family response regulator
MKRPEILPLPRRVVDPAKYTLDTFMIHSVKQRVLVVEDDPRMLELLCKGLREVGHTAMPASDGEAGLDLATSHDFDAIVLDLGLPIRDGMQIIASLRVQQRSTPILIVTARDTEDDIIRGLEAGADHYLVKPFSFPELLARLDGLTRTPSRAVDDSIGLNPLRLTALRDNSIIQLTRSEFLLLSALCSRPGRPVPREVLAQSVWGEAYVDPNSLDVLVNSLRSKFDGPYATKRILTVRGLGYVFQSENASCGQPSHSMERQQ